MFGAQIPGDFGAQIPEAPGSLKTGKAGWKTGSLKTGKAGWKTEYISSTSSLIPARGNCFSFLL
jgi:hypothetical protein